MSFWRLTIERPNRYPEVFDLRDHSKIRIGDDSRNEVCIRSTKLPFRLKVLDRDLRGNLRIHLTDEIATTLKGSFTRVGDWRTKLYTGATYQITGEAFFKVENTSFFIEEIDEIVLAPLARTYDPEAVKDAFKSVGLSGAIHFGLFLILLLATWLGNYFHKDDQLAEMQKVTVAQVEKVFKKKMKMPEPEVVEQQPVPIPPDVKVTKQEAPVAKQDRSTAQVKSRNNLTAKGNKAPGKRGNAPAKNLNSMGLLAIQTNAHSSSKISLPVAAPTQHRTVNPNDTGLGMGDAAYGIGNSTNDDSGIARLGSLSGQSYHGGLARGVTARTGPAIQLSRREVEIRGGLDPAIIRQIIEERLSEVRYCYETALLKQTNLAGKISTSWTINGDGSVANVTSSSAEIDQNILHPCLKNQIVKWRFPSPKGGGVVHVKYPFVFNPVGGT